MKTSDIRDWVFPDSHADQPSTYDYRHEGYASSKLFKAYLPSPNYDAYKLKTNVDIAAEIVQLTNPSSNWDPGIQELMKILEFRLSRSSNNKDYELIAYGDANTEHIRIGQKFRLLWWKIDKTEEIGSDDKVYEVRTGTLIWDKPSKVVALFYQLLSFVGFKSFVKSRPFAKASNTNYKTTWRWIN